ADQRADTPADLPAWATADWARDLLRGAGLRATAARIAVTRHLAAAGQPRTHAEVVDGLGDAGFDPSTVFRCLNELADKHLVARLDLGDQVRRFELAGAGGEGEAEHAHFMCIDCGRLSCLEGYSVQVTSRGNAKQPPLGRVTEVLLRGHCGDCKP
ncbi:MAG: transcriptional repressor, partial [Planctomycetota bacterium]